MVADSFQGEPIDCIGGVINDLTADSKGGLYFTMGRLFHVDPKGTITRYGENLTTNGVILSADEKTLYVTNGQTLAAFDVQKDGSLTNQREFAKLTAGGGAVATLEQNLLPTASFDSSFQGLPVSMGGWVRCTAGSAGRLKITDGVMRHLAVSRVKGGQMKAPAQIATVSVPADDSDSGAE